MPKINIDFRLDTPGFELSALRSALTTLERQLEEFTARRTNEVDRYISNLDLTSEDDRGEAQLAHQELEWEVRYTLPRVYRGGLLLLIWAAYESGIAEVAEFIQGRLEAGLGLSDIRGRTTFDRAILYFPEVLRFELLASADSRSRLRELELVRNAFAHANGNLRRTSSSVRRVIDAMVNAGKLEEDWGRVRPTKDYLTDALRLVVTELDSLVDRAKAWDDERRPARMPTRT